MPNCILLYEIQVYINLMPCNMYCLNFSIQHCSVQLFSFMLDQCINFYTNELQSKSSAKYDGKNFLGFRI